MSASCELAYVAAQLLDRQERIPYWHLTTGRPGETFVVMAAQHGSEVQGCEVIRRFREVCARDLVRGEVYLIPFTNPPALRHRRSHTTLGPEQPYADDRGENMNRTWPGHPEGNNTERLSYAIHQAIISHGTRLLDLHSWSRFTATCTLVRADCGSARQQAEVAQIPFTMGVERPQLLPGHPGPVGVSFNDDGRGALCIELAPQWVIREKEVVQGLRAATNLAKLFGMIEGDIEEIAAPRTFFTAVDRDKRTHTVRAPRNGLFVENGLETADYVETGQKLGHLICDDDLEIVDLLSPTSGLLWQYGCHREHSDVMLPAMHPHASEGDVLASAMTL